MLLTLADLQPTQINQPPRSTSLQRRNLQARLDLVLRQWQLGLDNQAAIDHDPELSRLVTQINHITPRLFAPHKRLNLQAELVTPLSIPNQEPVMIQATVNLGFKRSVPKLFDWSLRQPKLSWRDCVSCWAVAEHYTEAGVVPSQIKLVVVALHLNQPPTPVMFHWNRRLHKQTDAWLVKRVQGEAKQELPRTKSYSFDLSELLDLNAIPEIPI